MTRFAKLPLTLLAMLAMLVLAVLFLSPGFARAEDTAGATASSAAATSTDSTSSAAATTTGAQQDAAVPNAVTDPLPCDPTHLTDCIDCTVEPFKSLPPCITLPPSPPPACQELTDLPDCTPDCAFLAEVLGQDICTTLPQCLDPTLLPPDFPAIPGLPLCEASSPSSTPPPSSGGVYYKNCDDARAHGASNIHRGEPGYRKALDRDNDGIACETSTPSGSTHTPPPKAPAPQPVAAPVVDQLAYTGAVPTPVALAGFGLVLGGAGLLRLSRRPR